MPPRDASSEPPETFWDAHNPIDSRLEPENEQPDQEQQPQHKRRQEDDRRLQRYSKWASRAALCTITTLVLYQARRRWKNHLWPFLLAFISGSKTKNTSLHIPSSRRRAIEVSWSQLQQAALQGLVTKALIGPDSIVFLQRNATKWNRSNMPQNMPKIREELLNTFRQTSSCEVSALPESLLSRLGTPLLAALPFVYLGIMYKILKNIHGGGTNMNLLDNNKSSPSQTPTTFSDVAGLDASLLDDVKEIVHFLRDPESYERVGAQPLRGLLLSGRPGCGKTLLAKAIAGEANTTFIACSGSDFCEMYVGRGAARVRSLFEQTRSMAQHRSHKDNFFGSWWPFHITRKTDKRPLTAIIFIDELDALAKSRSSGFQSNDERDQTLNQLLTEMDGFHSQESHVTIIVIAATNRADVLDPAILRRFDRQLHVPCPSLSGRVDILKVHARKKECDMEQVDWHDIAELTPNCTGSELRSLVNDASLLAARDSSLLVEHRHFLLAAKRTHSMKTSFDMRAGYDL